MQFNELIDCLSDKRYALVDHSPELNRLFVFVEDSFKYEKISVEHCDKQCIAVIVSFSNQLVDAQWIRKAIERRISQNGVYYLSHQDSLMFSSYYSQVYLRDDTFEHISNMPYIVSEKEVECFLKNNGFRFKYKYKATKYLDRKITFVPRHVKTLYVMYKCVEWSRSYINKFFSKLVFIIFKNGTKKKFLSDLGDGRNIKSISFSNSNSMSLFFKEEKEDNSCFYKVPACNFFDTVKIEKHSLSIISKFQSSNQSVLLNIPCLANNAICFDFLTYPTLGSYVSINKLDDESKNNLKIFLIDVLDILYKCRIIHRDIREENIIVIEKSDSLDFRLIDFGCSVCIDDLSLWKNNFLNETYRKAGIMCRAGTNIWDDAGSALLLYYNLFHELPRELIDRLGRMCLFTDI